MRKQIAKKLTELAEKLPTVFEAQPDTVLMTGEELKLTPLADRVEPGKVYEVPIPKYVAVEHRLQLKDAYKRGGLPAVEQYMNKVFADASNGTLMVA